MNPTSCSKQYFNTVLPDHNSRILRDLDRLSEILVFARAFNFFKRCLVRGTMHGSVIEQKAGSSGPRTVHPVESSGKAAGCTFGKVKRSRAGRISLPPFPSLRSSPVATGGGSRRGVHRPLFSRLQLIEQHDREYESVGKRDGTSSVRTAAAYARCLTILVM